MRKSEVREPVSVLYGTEKRTTARSARSVLSSVAFELASEPAWKRA